MRRGKIRLAALFCLLHLPACRGVENDGVRTIRFPQAVNEDHPRIAASRSFARRLEAETGGRLRVSLFPGGQLYTARQAVEAAALADVEMALEPETHFITFDDAFKAVDIPFLFEGEEDFRRFLEGSFRERVVRSLESRGLVLLGLWDEGPMVLGSRRKTLVMPEDFRGIKIRSSGHDLLARSWNEMGATTIRLPIEEVYTALQQGVADAIYTTLHTFVSGKLQEVAPKVVLWPSRAVYVWVVNRSFWQSLDPEDRALALRLADQARTEYHQRLGSSLQQMVRAIESVQGGEFLEPGEDERERLRARIDHLLGQWRSEYEAVISGTE